MGMLEGQAPQLANNPIWTALKGKKPEEITAYAGNMGIAGNLNARVHGNQQRSRGMAKYVP